MIVFSVDVFAIDVTGENAEIFPSSLESDDLYKSESGITLIEAIWVTRLPPLVRFWSIAGGEYDFSSQISMFSSKWVAIWLLIELL